MQNKQEVEVKKQSKSNAGFVFLVTMLIAIIMVSSSMGLYAWARYSTKTPGNTTGQVAKWHFELKPGKVEGTPLVNFAITRTDGYSYVKPERLAPGTFGIIPMEIDTTETEVTMTYEVKVQLKDCPANMKFYADSGKTKQLERKKVTIEGEIYDVITISRYLSLDMVGEDPNKHTEVDDVHDETIYWEWPYQTIVEENGVQNAVAGDMQDTQDQGKTVMMNIVATGIQNVPQSLADVAKVGDYVNYDANSNGTYTKTGTVMEGVTIKDNETFTTAESVKWRILSINEETDEITIMAEDPILKTGSTTSYKQVALDGINGYKNIEEGLKEIGSIYGYGKGAESGRSIKLEDIMQYSNFDPTTQYSNSFSSNGTVGGTRTYTDVNKMYILGEEYNGKPVVQIPEGVTVRNYTNGTKGASPVTVTQTYYNTKDEATTKASFTGKDAENGERIYNMLFKRAGDVSRNKNKYWLASRCVSLSIGICTFEVRYVIAGRVEGYDSFSSNGSSNEQIPAYAFVPVVTLKTNIQTTGQVERSMAVESRLS